MNRTVVAVWVTEFRIATPTLYSLPHVSLGDLGVYKLDFTGGGRFRSGSGPEHSVSDAGQATSAERPSGR